MKDKGDTLDVRVAEIAMEQHGVVTLRQLEEAGLGRRGASRRVAKGQLHRLHRGVYAVGHRAPTHHSRWMAAVLACGEGAVLSHHSAAALWELLKPIRGPIHVSVPTTSGLKKRSGIHLHRCPSLGDRPPSPPSPADRGGRGRGITRRHNIPATTIQRTINDLEDSVAPYLLRRAKRQAELKGIRLEGSEGKRLRSDLEEDFLALIDRLPPPEANVKVDRYEVDFLWRQAELVVEVDSWTYHRGSVGFHEDRARELRLRERGFTVLRFSEAQIEEEPARVAGDVARALGKEDLVR